MWSTTCWTLDLVDIRECIKKREITDVRKSGVFLLTAEKSGRGEGGWRKGERDGLISKGLLRCEDGRIEFCLDLPHLGRSRFLILQSCT